MSIDETLDDPRRQNFLAKDPPATLEDRLDHVIAEYLKALARGDTVDREQILAQHPDLAQPLDEFFADRERLEEVAAPVRAAAVPSPGMTSRFFGDYELLDEVARGGMGVVYRARQLSLDRIVAIKMILAGRLASDDDVRRFRTEAQAAASLQHPNIVAIHEVGENNGQHYFSMDYVDGISLADLVRENPLPAPEAASLVRSIATAIQYAHSKRILHRDLKPSNVLLEKAESGESRAESRHLATNSDLDHRGSLSVLRPMVTDFGLAKHFERGSDLTGSGQILGTPSYMPPEQVKGARGEIGPASDVYSLGAILYELLTGRPPFRAETPLDTLYQVLESEPAPPRLLNPRVPRDLETVCLKCLRKRPSHRYESAGSFVDDLDRFLSGEPVLARRPGLVERAVRWVKKQRRGVVTALVAAGISSIILVGVILGRLAYGQWKLGHVSIYTTGPALTAEILDDSDELAVPRVAAPTQDPISLAFGSYSVRLSGQNVVSETYQMTVERARRLEFKVPSDNRSLWDPISVPRSYEIIKNDSGADLLLLSGRGLQRVDGQTAKSMWEVTFYPKTQSKLAGLIGFDWDWGTGSDQRGRGTFDRRPQLINSEMDIDQDGSPDLIWAGRHQSFVLAISGTDGKVLWSFTGSLGIEKNSHSGDAPPTSDSTRSTLSNHEGTILGEPALFDVDGDGLRDLIMTFATVERDPNVQNGWARNPRRWIEAISSRTGESLWSYMLDDKWFCPSGTSQVPWTCRWPNSRNQWSMGGYSGTSPRGAYANHRGSLSGSWEFAHVPFAARLVKCEGRQILAAIAGSRLIVVDPMTGRSMHEPTDLGHSPVRSPLFADVDRDGTDEVITLCERPTKNMGWGREMGTTLSAFNLPSARKKQTTPMWYISPEAAWDGLAWFDDPLDWPLVSDLDEDGIPELVVPSQLPADATDRNIPWAGIQLISGKDGSTRWHVRIRSKHHQVDRMIVGPDIDADGHRDIFSASTVAWPDGMSSFSLFVDALSGKDGRTLWWREIRLGDSFHTCRGLGIGPLSWWNIGSDGWPQLVVPYTAHLEEGVPKTYFVSAGSGRILQTAVGARDPRTADLDGDGTSDLIDFRPSQLSAFDAGGKLSAVRGSSPSEWRRLGGVWRAAQDFDGDEIEDLVQTNGTFSAISGRDGHMLWQVRAASNQFQSAPLPYGDLDRDGTPDVVIPYNQNGTTINVGLLPLQAVSGRTGKRLWASEPMNLYGGRQFLEFTDLEQDGYNEIVCACIMDKHSLGSGTWQWWLTVYSGSTGEIRWRQPLSDRASWQSQFDSRFHLQTNFADVNDDNVKDLVFPVITTRQGYELRAYSGTDGAVLWRRLLPAPNDFFSLVKNFPTTSLTDLNGDGTCEIVSSEYGPQNASLVVLDGHNGKDKWRWPYPDKTTNPNERFPPFKIRLSGQQTLIGVVSTKPDNPLVKVVVLLDHNGKAVQSREISTRSPLILSQIVSSHDVDGDGLDELLFVDSARLIATRGGLQDQIWNYALSPHSGEIVEIRPAQAGKSPTIVVDIGPTLLGIDGLTGHESWRFAGIKPTYSLLRTNHPTEPPLVVESSDMVTLCRQATGEPVTSTKVRTSRVPVGATHRPPARVASSSIKRVDPRLLRRLPWSQLAEMQEARIELAVSVSMAIVGLVIPGTLIVTAIRRRKMSLQRLLAIMAALGAAFALVRFLSSEALDISSYLQSLSGPLLPHRPFTVFALRSPWNLFLLSVQGTILLTFPYMIVISVVRGQWTRLSIWVSIAAAIVAAIVTISMLIDAASMDAREQYSWDYWYWCLLPTNMLVGAMITLTIVVRGAWSLLRRTGVRREPTIAPS